MLGGAIGSALRFLMATSIDRWTGVVFPWGTVLVNIVGCFVIGLVAGLTSSDSPLMVPPVVRTFIMIGILGGFTTFSSFSLQTITLMQDGEWLWAGGNVLISVIVCLVATAGGIALASAIARSY